MPLINKDGTPYKLPNTNVLMQTQTTWNKYILHNMQFNKASLEIKNKKEKHKQSIIIEEQPKINIVEEKEIQKEEIIDDKFEKYKVVFSCLPAIFIEKKDSLYEENYREIKYGKNFTFEGFIFENIDLCIKIWCKVNVLPRSIIYPKIKKKDGGK